MFDAQQVQAELGRFGARLGNWDSSAEELKWIGAGLLALSVCATLFVSSYLEDPNRKKWIRPVAFVAAASAALLAAFNPIAISYKYRDAWRILDNALLRYNADKSDQNFSKVLDAVAKGEEIIGSAPIPGEKLTSAGRPLIGAPPGEGPKTPE